jgi:hypothetical protein
LGDSYAFGIAGTGGTSSSSSPPAELCTFLGFGVGRRDPDKAGLPRGKRDVATLKEFALEVDDSETPDAYDLRFWVWSGVPRAEEGVTLFLKIMAGD